MNGASRNAKATKKKEIAFVQEYCRNPKALPLALVSSAGFNPANKEEAEEIYKKLLNKKSIAESICKHLNDWRSSLDGKAKELVAMLTEMATFDANDIFTVKNGKTIVKNTDDMPFASRNMIKSVSINEGKVTLTLHDRYPYVKMLADIAGVMNKISAPRMEPHPEQKQALLDVRNGVRTPIEAALDLEAQGIPVPETIHLLVSRPEVTVGVKQEVALNVPTPEEMAERRKRLLDEVEDEKMSFLPARQAEVRELKADLGTANKAFDVTQE